MEIERIDNRGGANDGEEKSSSNRMNGGVLVLEIIYSDTLVETIIFISIKNIIIVRITSLIFVRLHNNMKRVRLLLYSLINASFFISSSIHNTSYTSSSIHTNIDH